MKATEETKQKAKELGVKSWHIKSQEKLEDEIKIIELAQESVGEVQETVTVDTAETVVEEVKEDPIPDLVELMAGCTWDRAYMAIKMNGKKSKFWPHRKIITEKGEAAIAKAKKEAKKK